MKNKIFKYIYLAVLYLPPILNLVVFYAYICRVIGKIGFIPSHNNPDPGTIVGLEFHKQLIYDLFDLQIISSIAIFVGFILSFILKGDFFKKLRIHYLIAFILIIFCFIGPFEKWFLD